MSDTWYAQEFTLPVLRSLLRQADAGEALCRLVRDYEYLRSRAEPYSADWQRADGALVALDSLGATLYGHTEWTSARKKAQGRVRR